MSCELSCSTVISPILLLGAKLIVGAGSSSTVCWGFMVRFCFVSASSSSIDNLTAYLYINDYLPT